MEMIADPLDGVTTFLAVAETSSFTAAAGRLGCSKHDTASRCSSERRVE
jgi:DNA-binding transcriptional LysR family regulator